MMRFARTMQLIGEDGLARLRGATVAVFGLGAVGSYVVEALARAGVGGLVLFDHDTVSASNINRQLFALHSTLGRPKAEVARERVLDINPDCRVESRVQFVDGENVAGLLEQRFDVVVDAIDGVNSKVNLIIATRVWRWWPAWVPRPSSTRPRSRPPTSPSPSCAPWPRSSASVCAVGA